MGWDEGMTREKRRFHVERTRGKRLVKIIIGVRMRMSENLLLIEAFFPRILFLPINFPFYLLLVVAVADNCGTIMNRKQLIEQLI
jgi:hypothetical protein